jgi:FkbM family methyltransferase
MSGWVKGLFTPLLGRRRYQPVFDALHRASLAGLNLGQVGETVDRGERASLSFLRGRLALGPGPVTVFDVGANVGDYVTEVLAEFGGQAAVWAFEPAGSTYGVLAHRYGDHDNVEVRNVGFSDRGRQAKLFSKAPGAKVASLHEGHWGQDDRYELVDLTTIDEFCATQGVERIHLMKLDVEGHELAVLAGARSMLERGRIDALQFEFGIGNMASRTYLRDFFDLLGGSFDMYRILRDGPYPVPTHRYRDEVFAGATNYLAIRTPRG